MENLYIYILNGDLYMGRSGHIMNDLLYLFFLGKFMSV